MSSQNIPQSSLLVKTSPHEIYLNVFESADDCTSPFPKGVGEEITWSEQACLAGSVRYVRADLAAQLEADKAELLAWIIEMDESLNAHDEYCECGGPECLTTRLRAILAKHGAAK